MKIRLTDNFKDSIFYSFGNYVFSFSSAITNIFVNRLLGATLAGAISYINAIDQNVDLLYSPIRAAIEREFPKLRKESISEASVFAETSFLINYAFIFLGSFIYFLIFLLNDNQYIKEAALFFIGLNVVKALSSLLRIYHKALYNFKAISLTLFLVALAQPVVILPLIRNYNYNGFFVGRIIVFFLTFIILLKFLPALPKLNFKLEFVIIKKIYVLGFPIVLFSIISILLITIDKFFIEKYLSLKALGFYSIGTMIFQVLLLLPNSIYGSYYPKFMTKAGNQNDKILLITKIVKVVMLPVILIAWLSIHPLLYFVLPDFLPGENSAKLLLLAVYFAATFQMYYIELVRNNKVMKINLYSSVLIIISLPLFWLAVNHYQNIESVAWVTILNYFFLSIITISLSHKSMNLNFTHLFKILASNIFYLIPVVPLVVLDIFLKSHFSYKIIAIEIAMFLLLYSPFIYKVWKGNEIKKTIFH